MSTEYLDNLMNAYLDKISPEEVWNLAKMHLGIMLGGNHIQFIYDEFGVNMCNYCLLPNEAIIGNIECECKCPECNMHSFDDTTIIDHGRCYDCHQKWKISQKEQEPNPVKITIRCRYCHLEFAHTDEDMLFAVAVDHYYGEYQTKSTNDAEGNSRDDIKELVKQDIISKEELDARE